MPIRIFLVLLIFALIHPSSLIAFTKQKAPPPEIKRESPTLPEVLKTNAGQRESAEVLPGLITAQERRTALVIGNSSYDTGSLRNPVNDADDMASTLKRLGFDVVLKKNTSQQDMEDAVRNFGDRLKRGGVGLFFYAGHGVQISGKNFLLPIGVKIDRETDVKYRAVDADMVLDEMGNAGNPVNIVILDACRDNPFGKSFRTASRGLAIISSAPRGTLISYSTNPGNVAADGNGRNSPYTESLLKHMATPDLPIEHVFKKVRQELNIKTNGRQTPWELSSLSGDFFFNSNTAKQKIQPAVTDKTYQDADLAAERRKIAEEKEKLRREKELLEEEKALAETKKSLEEERRKLEEERQKLAYGPKVDPAKGTRYIDLLNAKVTDVKFFEGPYDPPAEGARSYQTSFPRTTTRFINWQLNFQFPMPGVDKDFIIEHIWFNPSGKEILRGTWNAHILGNWSRSIQTHSYGWREASSSNWVVGTYRVDLYVKGVKIASENFNIY